LVEVHVAVQDRGGRPVRGLKGSDFEIFDENERREPEIFESEESPFSIALLLDASGSMEADLPLVKRAALTMLEQLRPEDRVAVFCFSDRTIALAEFTAERAQLGGAIRRLRAEGTTALFDALGRVAPALLARPGKKALVVFTDGDDNASALALLHAVDRFRRESVPVYALAYGSALKSRKLRDTLEQMARLTGGESLEVRGPQDALEAFTRVSKDLTASYLLAFRARPGKGEWRRLRVFVPGRPGARLRHREGYIAR
jgi:Ca-activated chloride channel family protein